MGTISTFLCEMIKNDTNNSSVFCMNLLVKGNAGIPASHSYVLRRIGRFYRSC